MANPAGGAEDRVLGYVELRRNEIAGALDALLARKGAELARVSPLGAEACGKLGEFASRGKMIRGALVSYASGLGGMSGDAPVAVGMAMELFQSALLVHDDIMDRDAQRRGRPSVHFQYAEEARGAGLREPDHLGNSLGICAGDIAFFLAFEVLGELGVDPAIRARLVSLFSRELALVGVAQMMDMAAAASSSEKSVEEILRLYLYKTGRYTFSLPLVAGGILGGLAEERVSELDRVGEHLGMLFQIKDDEIGLFGDPADTGKPVGSDIREGKKTIFHAFLLRLSPQGSLWGEPDLSEADVRAVLLEMERTGVRAEVERLTRSLADRAAEITGRDGYAFLGDLLSYSLGRRR